MKSLKIAFTLIISIFIITACEEEISNEYVVSEELQALINYGEGTEWKYDVEMENEVELNARFFVSDTVARDEIDYKGEPIEIPASTIRRNIDTTFYFMDSVFLLGKYRYYYDTIHVKDSVYFSPLRYDPRRGSNRSEIIYSNVIRSAWDKGKDDEDPYNDPDSILFEYFYNINLSVSSKQLFDVLEFNDNNEIVNLELMDTVDVMYVDKIEQGNVEFSVRNRSSLEGYNKGTIKSSLNPEISYIETVSASSSGYQYYRRDKASFKSYVNTIELAFDSEGVMDTTMLAASVGVTSYKEVGSVNLNGKTYNNVIQILTSFVDTNIDGDQVNTNLEYWYIKEFGMIKIDDKTNKITWTLL